MAAADRWEAIERIYHEAGALTDGVREAAFRAIIPTDAPFWLDRGVLAAAAVVTVLTGLGAAFAMFRAP